MIYLDSSAVVKLVRRERGTAELLAWLGGRPSAPLVSSVLVEVEVTRALRRHAPESLAGVSAVLGRLYRVEIDATTRAVAAAYPDPGLRSLDAIHLATAHVLARESDDLESFVAYDDRLLAAARRLSLPALAPA